MIPWCSKSVSNELCKGEGRNAASIRNCIFKLDIVFGNLLQPSTQLTYDKILVGRLPLPSEGYS